MGWVGRVGWVQWFWLGWMGLVGSGWIGWASLGGLDLVGWVVRLGGWVRFWFGLFEVGGLDVFDLLEYSGYLCTVYMYSVQCTVYSVLC